MRDLHWPGPLILAIAAGLSLMIPSCTTMPPNPVPGIGSIAPRTGDEIVVAGQFVHTGTRVVLWLDPGGYDAYRVERRFSPLAQADWGTMPAAEESLTQPNRYGQRLTGFGTNEIERVRGGGWDLPTLQQVVDQFVLHYDACGTSREAFRILHDHRGLSVHFLLDLDGTIYQTLDVKERAWHATTANQRSVGVEIANIGAFPAATEGPLTEWYGKDPEGRTRITIPARFGDGGMRTPEFVGRPARDEAIQGVVQGMELTQYDFTPEQYRALAHLTAALCRTLPQIKCDYPRDEQGRLITQKLSDEVLASYHGVLGHYHVQTNKTDPGPALDWDRLMSEARRLMKGTQNHSAEFLDTSSGHQRIKQ